MALTAIVKYLAVKRYIISTITILIFISFALITKNAIGQTEDEKYLYGQELYEKTFGQSEQVSKLSEANDNLNVILPILALIVIFFALYFV